VSLLELLLLSLGMAMDATAVSAARGLSAERVRVRDALTLALLFGCFHVVMPVLGWQLGQWVGRWVQAWDHWVAFVLLAGLGAKMVWEALHSQKEAVAPTDAFAPGVLLTLAVATSLDALAVGVTLPMIRAPLWLTVGLIGLVTALCSAVAVWWGRRLGAAFGPRVDILGGLVLIGVGARVLIEHLSTH